MSNAYIVGAVRSAVGVGKAGKGALSLTRADELLAKVLSGLVARVGLDPLVVEDVIAGCVTPIGEQGLNIARIAALEAGFPVEVCGVSLNRMCGSSQQAVNYAAQAVMSGQQDVVIGCGVEVMSRTRMGTDAMAGDNGWFPPPAAMTDRFELVSQGLSAEMIAERWRLSRRALDELSLASHARAVASHEKGEFAREILPIEVADAMGEKWIFERDEGPRADGSLEKLAGLKPSFKPDGVIHAGNSSQISDGAAALMIASEAAVKKYGLKPRARIVATAVAGVDPVIMLTGPIPATKKALAKAGLDVSAIDLFEVNEAFAPVPLAWAKDTGADLAKTNVRGGAIALGHPLGASGARLMTTLLHALEDRGGRYGLQTMCIGFGQATATIIDRKV